jgi:hypothetical protein
MVSWDAFHASLSEQDAKDYLEQVLAEIKRQKRSP